MLKEKFVRPALLAIAILATCTGCNRGTDAAAAQQKALGHIERAESYRQQGQYRAALIEARNALQQSPNDRTATLKMASILIELGQGKAALKLLEPVANESNRHEAIAIAQSYFLQHKYQSCLDYLAANSTRLNLQGDAEATLLKARAQMHLDQLDAATDSLGQLSSTYTAANIERVRLARQRGDIVSSKQQLEALLAQHPENVDALLEAAAQAEANGDLERAEDLLSKTLMNLPATDVLTPQRGETLQRLITTLTKLGRSNEALAYSKTLADANPEGMALQDKLKEAIELFQAGKYEEADPLLQEIYNESNNETVGSLLGMIRFAKNDLRGAASYLSSNIDPETSGDTALTVLAASQLELSQPAQLLQIFDERARARIVNPELKALVGIALLQTGNQSEGEKFVAEAQRAKPNNPAIASALTRFYLQNSEPQKAIAALKAVGNAESDPNLSQLLIAAYLAANNDAEALKLAQKLTKQDAGRAENWWMLGHSAVQSGDYASAETALQKALQLRADYTTAQLDLAQLYLLRKQPDRAAALYRSVLARQPNTLGALKGFILAAAAQGSDAKTVEHDLLALADNAQSRAALADYFLHQGLDADARRLLGTLGDAPPEYAARVKQASVLKGAAQALNERRFDDARKQVLEALQGNARNPNLVIMLARIEYGADKIDEAKKIAAQLATQQPQYPPVQELLGDLAMLERQAGAATQHYQQAWSKAPSDTIGKKLYQSLAQADKTAATDFLKQWQQAYPNSAMPYFILAAQQQRAGDNAAAIISYEAAIARNPEDATSLNNLAILYQALQDSRALATAARAYQLAPNDPAILDTYGWLLVQAKQRDKALPLLQRAAQLVPQSEEVKQHLQAAQALPH